MCVNSTLQNFFSYTNCYRNLILFLLERFLNGVLSIVFINAKYVYRGFNIESNWDVFLLKAIKQGNVMQYQKSTKVSTIMCHASFVTTLQANEANLFLCLLMILCSITKQTWCAIIYLPDLFILLILTKCVMQVILSMFFGFQFIRKSVN